MTTRPLRTLLVGFDGTEPARRALDRAAELAAVFGAKLVVASVAPVVHSAGRSVGAIDPLDPPERHEQELAEARALLDERDVPAEYVPAIGEPAGVLLQLADERDVDLIVVGTREPGLLDRLMQGSVSRAVSHHARRDVLIVH